MKVLLNSDAKRYGLKIISGYVWVICMKDVLVHVTKKNIFFSLEGSFSCVATDSPSVVFTDQREH